MKNILNLLRNRTALPETHKKITAVLTNGELVLEIYGDIGASFWGDGITAQQVADALKSNPDSITVRINSPGGDAFEGVAIYNLLRSAKKPVSVIVDGIAASAASVIAMAGDTIVMGNGTQMMIHPALTLAFGDSVELHHTAAILEKVTGSMADIYIARTGGDRAELLVKMYEELWLNADEAVEQGFADSVSEVPSKAGEIAANYNLAVFAKTPEALKQPVVVEEATARAIYTGADDLNLYGL